jgi:hypothetical protein
MRMLVVPLVVGKERTRGEQDQPQGRARKKARNSRKDTKHGKQRTGEGQGQKGGLVRSSLAGREDEMRRVPGTRSRDGSCFEFSGKMECPSSGR